MRVFGLLFFGATTAFSQSWTTTFQHPPTADAYFSVGYAEETALEEARSKAWLSAVTAAVSAHVPEAMWFTTHFNETLTSLESQRELALSSAQLLLKDLSEAQDLGSPVVRRKGSGFQVWKLLKWTKSGIQTAKSALAKALSRGQPTKPVLMKPRSREKQIESYLETIKCGTNQDQVIEVLGPPDSFDLKENVASYLSFQILYSNRHNKYVWMIYDSQGNLWRRVCR